MIRIHTTGGWRGSERHIDLHVSGSAQDFLDAHDALDLAKAADPQDAIILDAFRRALVAAAGGREDPAKAPRSYLWPCGCLVNDAGAHRVGCPEHPEGVRA
jgi:hypothetical protein